MITNWKTTLFGILAAAAGGVATSNLDPTVTKIASILAAIFVGLLGIFSKDHDVTGGTKE